MEGVKNYYEGLDEKQLLVMPSIEALLHGFTAAEVIEITRRLKTKILASSNYLSSDLIADSTPPIAECKSPIS